VQHQARVALALVLVLVLARGRRPSSRIQGAGLAQVKICFPMFGSEIPGSCGRFTMGGNRETAGEKEQGI